MITALLSASTLNVLKPVTGLFMTSIMTYNLINFKRLLRPTYDARLQLIKRANEEIEGEDEPNDLLQMMIRYAQKERPGELYDFDLFARRLATLNFGSIHPTNTQVR